VIFLNKFCYCCGRPSSEVVCSDCQKLLSKSQEGGCRICARPLWGLNDTCWACRDNELVVKKIMAPYYYEGLAKILFQEYKFNRGWSLTPFWVKSLFSVWEDLDYTLVPIPPKKSSLEKRGWDPVEHLWKRLCAFKITGKKLFYPISSAEQKLLNRSQRKYNLSGIKLISTAIPQKIVLLDDTVTTGSTLNAFAKILLEHGAHEVLGLALTLAP